MDRFLGVLNGKTFFVDSEPVPMEEFSTDACPIGGGGFFQGDWFYVNWALNHPGLANAHIIYRKRLRFVQPLNAGRIACAISGSLCELIT